MTVKKHFSYGCDVDTLFDLVTNEDALVKKYESCGGRNINFSNCESEGDTRRLAWTREMPADPPGFAKKFMAEWNTLTETLAWTRKGDEVHGAYSSEVKGVPGAISGTLIIKPADGGCAEDVSMTAEVKVPLVGKKIAALVEDDISDNLDKEDAYHSSQVG